MLHRAQHAAPLRRRSLATQQSAVVPDMALTSCFQSATPSLRRRTPTRLAAERIGMKGWRGFLAKFWWRARGYSNFNLVTENASTSLGEFQGDVCVCITRFPPFHFAMALPKVSQRAPAGCGVTRKLHSLRLRRCSLKKLATFCLLLLMSLPAGAVEGEQVKYLGGTVADLHAGLLGRLDTTAITTLTYEYSGNKLVIPYAKIDSFEYSVDVARHLGVLAAIAVALVRARQRRHFFRISYHDENNVSQVAIFEVPKWMPQTLLAVLQVRAPQGCKPSPLTQYLPMSRCGKTN
jgi:hypothetical protein